MLISEGPARTSLLEQGQLELELKRVLHTTIFSSNLCISPRRVGQIALDMAKMLRQFLEQQDNAEATHAYGQHLAGEGVGHRSILALVEVLHCASWAQADSQGVEIPASIACSSHLLAGYMAGREAYLLQEQERTRLALERARAHMTA
jgi:hypothetical protein